MRMILFPLLILLLSPNIVAQSKLFDELGYRIEIGVLQNSLFYTTGANSTSVNGQTEYNFIDSYLLPSFQVTAIYPLGEKFELDIHTSYLVFGGRKDFGDGNEEHQQIKSLGLGVTPSYLITKHLRIGLILEDNIVLDVETVVKNMQTTSTYNETDAHNNHVLRIGLRIDFNFKGFVLAGKYSMTATNLLKDSLVGDLSKTNNNIGLSLGYRFGK